MIRKRSCDISWKLLKIQRDRERGKEKMRTFQSLFCINFGLLAILKANDHFEFFRNIKKSCGIAEFGFAMNTIYLIILNIVTFIKPPDTSMDSVIYILVNLLEGTTYLCILCVASFVILFFLRWVKEIK